MMNRKKITTLLASLLLSGWLPLAAQTSYVKEAFDRFVSAKHVDVRRTGSSGKEPGEAPNAPEQPWSYDRYSFSMPRGKRADRLLKMLVSAYDNEQKTHQADFSYYREGGQEGQPSSPVQYSIRYAKSETPIVLGQDGEASLLIVCKIVGRARMVYVAEWKADSATWHGMLTVAEGSAKYSDVKKYAQKPFSQVVDSVSALPVPSENIRRLRFYADKFLHDTTNVAPIVAMGETVETILLEKKNNDMQEAESILIDFLGALNIPVSSEGGSADLLVESVKSIKEWGNNIRKTNQAMRQTNELRQQMFLSLSQYLHTTSATSKEMLQRQTRQHMEKLLSSEGLSEKDAGNIKRLLINQYLHTTSSVERGFLKELIDKLGSEGQKR